MGMLTSLLLTVSLWTADPLYDASQNDASQNPPAQGQSEETTPEGNADLGPTEAQLPVNTIVSPEEPPLAELVYADKTDEEVIQIAIDYLENIETLSGKFYQQAPSGTLSTGQFYIRRPGLLRFDYDPPTDLLIVANGGTVFVTDEALKTTDSYPVGRTPLKFLLRKKVKLDDAQIVGVERGPEAFAITLSAQDEETEGELTLAFSAPEVGLVRWVVRDARNGLTIVDLTNVKQDERLRNELFRIPETKSPFLKNR